MSAQSLRASRKFTTSPTPHSAATEDHLYRGGSDKRTRNQPPHSITYTRHARKSPKPLPSSSSSRKSKMGQPPPNQVNEQPYYFFPNMQALDPTQEIDLHAHPWMMATMIEDDDLQFGGKPLSTWYEEDRRRYSLGEESAPSPGFEEEEERRGRQRDRPHYHKSSHSHKHHKTSGKTGEEMKH